MVDRHPWSIAAIVPMKALDEAKGRLAVAVDPSERIALSRRMLDHTLHVLNGVPEIARTLVVSRDRQVLRVARRHKAWSLFETGHGLNMALEQATRVARANGMNAVLIVPADLPMLARSDVDRILQLGRTPPVVVIAPDRANKGTNALLVNPAGLFEYAFGENSYGKHKRRAEGAGARVQLYQSDRVAFDLDLPEDLVLAGPQVTDQSGD